MPEVSPAQCRYVRADSAPEDTSEIRPRGCKCPRFHFVVFSIRSTDEYEERQLLRDRPQAFIAEDLVSHGLGCGAAGRKDRVHARDQLREKLVTEKLDQRASILLHEVG